MKRKVLILTIFAFVISCFFICVDRLVYANFEEINQSVLKIESHLSEITIGETFRIPKASFEGVYIGSCTITTPAGDQRVIVLANDDTINFKPNTIGTYTITYVFGNGFSHSIDFKVLKTNYSICLNNNDQYILPTTIGTQDNIERMYLPNCVVKDKNGNVVVDSIVHIYVSDPTGQQMAIYNDMLNNAYYLNLSNFVVGDYCITYKAVSTSNENLCNLELSFKCVEGNVFNVSDNLELFYENEKPESLEIGKQTELPKVVGKIGEEVVPVYYTVKIFKNGTEEVFDGLVKDGDVYKFTAKEADFYKVEYIVNSALGLKTAETSFVINSVNDTISPTPIVVLPYTDLPSSLENKDYLLQSTYNSENIKILPIFATDYSTTNPSDIILERAILRATYEVIYKDVNNPNKNIIFNYTGDNISELALTESIVAKREGNNLFLCDGTYYVFYKATDKAGNSNTIMYKFNVISNYDGRDEESNPIVPLVEFDNSFPTKISYGESLFFSAPTFVEHCDDRLETKLYYQYFSESSAIITGGDNNDGKYYFKTNNDGNYTIDTSIATSLNATSIKIFVEAKSDAYYIAEANNVSDKDEFIGKFEHEILFEAYPVDTQAVYIKNVLEDGADENESILIHSEFQIPTVEFYDDNIEYLRIGCKAFRITEKYGMVNITTYGGEVIKQANQCLYTGAKVNANMPGTYIISVTATELYNNSVTKFFKYYVEEQLRLKVENLKNETIELGETYNILQAQITGYNSTAYNWEVRCIEATSTEYTLNRNRFIANKAGEYKIQYFLYDTSETIPTPYGDQVCEFTITVEDTTAPEVYVDWSTSILDNPDIPNSGEGSETIIKGENNKVAIENTYKKGTKFLIPMFSAQDLSGIDANKSMITIRNSANSVTRTIKYSEMATEYAKGAEGTRMYFDFDDDAEYTITYTVYDKQGNSSTKEFTVKVGDLEAPILIVSDNIIKEQYYTTDVININLNNDLSNLISISDNMSILEQTDITITLTVNGLTVANQETLKGKYCFNLTNAGCYQITFKIRDNAGNKTSVIKHFEVVLDNLAPTIELENIEYSEVNKTVEIDLNSIVINDNYDKTLTYKDLDIVFKLENTVLLPQILNNGTLLRFNVEKTGLYNVLLSITDKAGNNTTKQVICNVTDTTKPILQINDLIVNNEYNRKSILIIDLNDENNYITVSDNFTNITKQEIDVKLYLNNNEVENTSQKVGEFKYNLIYKGDYTLVFSVKDNSNNESVITKTFSVKFEPKEIKDLIADINNYLKHYNKNGIFTDGELFFNLKDLYDYIMTIMDEKDWFNIDIKKVYLTKDNQRICECDLSYKIASVKISEFGKYGLEVITNVNGEEEVLKLENVLDYNNNTLVIVLSICGLTVLISAIILFIIFRKKKNIM